MYFCFWYILEFLLIYKQNLQEIILILSSILNGAKGKDRHENYTLHKNGKDIHLLLKLQAVFKIYPLKLL